MDLYASIPFPSGFNMPKKLDKLVTKLKKEGKSESSAYAIATSALQKSGYLKKGSRKLNRKKLGDTNG